MSEISPKEWVALEKKYSENKQMFSVIIEGYSVNILRSKKKSAGQAGSRGKYISNCILYFEKNSNSKSVLKEFEDELFQKELRIFYLERTLRDNSIKFDD